MGNVQDYMPSLLDREIDSDERDSFGHRHFALALKSLIESPTHVPPYSIGLLGKWGTGKSSIKEMYLKTLRDDHDRHKKVRSITFNAWRFGGENIKRALLRHVFIELGGDETAIKDALFNRLQRTFKEPRSFTSILWDVYETWGWALLQLILVYVFILFSLVLAQRLLGLSDQRVMGLLTAVFGVSGFLAFKQLVDLKRFFIPRYSSVTRIEGPMSSAEEYEDLLLDQLQCYKSGHNALRNGKNCERLVIFVDDLDRLSPGEMISGLDAVRTFMEIPQKHLPKGVGIIFVVSCDEERLAAALANSTHHASSTDLPGSVFTHFDAHRYLDRIFQFRLEIPSFPKRDMRNFATERFKTELKDISDDLIKRDVSLENVIDRMIHVGVQSPRNALQILNTFAHTWWLARKREFDGAGTERPGGLQEGAVTNHPISLAALCALRIDFPDFYADLEKEPGLINCFTDVFIRRKAKINELPESAKSILNIYLSADSQELSEKHKHLRQYIASLDGLRWPVSLGPLLLISQDPVARKLGDRAVRLFDSFVSGDTTGVLHEFGRANDAEPLAFDDVRMLRDLWEEMHHETTIRRNNAAAVISALARRIPDSIAPSLLSPLARQLVFSPDLRWRIGLPGIRDVLPQALASDRKEVAGELINDLLKMSGDTAFRLQSGEPPSLDEAIEAAKEACDLALWVREKDRLLPKHDKTLLEWLAVRRIALKGNEDALPFSALEAWMTNHERHLLPDFGSAYTTLLAAELEAQKTEQIDIEAAMRRCRIVFDRLMESGEDSRPQLWEFVQRFAAIQQKEAVALSWEFMNLHANTPSSKAISVFLQSLAGRLIKDMEDSEKWGLDWESGALALLTIVEKRLEDIERDTLNPLVQLCIRWSSTEETAQFAVDLIFKLMKMERGEADKVVADWTQRLFTDLPQKAANYLSSEYQNTLNDKQRSSLLGQLRNLHNRDNVSKEEGDHFQRFIRGLTGEAIASEPVQNYLSELFNAVAQRHENPNDYLSRIFPVVPEILPVAPVNPVCAMLDVLFVNSATKPKVLSWLHKQMVGHWPKFEGTMYNAQNLFDTAFNVINQQVKDELVTNLLESLSTMIGSGAVGDQNVPKLVQSACVVWPHHQQSATQTILTFSVAPPVETIANLMDSFDPSDEEQVSNLANVWGHIAESLDEDRVLEVARLILAKTVKGNEEIPDLCLRLWIGSMGERKSGLLPTLVSDSTLNDEQRSRLMQQLMENATEFGQEVFLNAIPRVFQVTPHGKTAKVLFEGKEMISALFHLRQEKLKLGHCLLQAFSATSSLEKKRLLAKWLSDLEVETVLKELSALHPEATPEELQILEESFPKTRYLSKA